MAFFSKLDLSPFLPTAVSLANIDGWIADWNVDRYQRGSPIAVDLPYLASLEAAALPAIARLVRVASERDGNGKRGQVQFLAFFSKLDLSPFLPVSP